MRSICESVTKFHSAVQRSCKSEDGLPWSTNDKANGLPQETKKKTIQTPQKNRGTQWYLFMKNLCKCNQIPFSGFERMWSP